jgi:uncharacterized membrane protein YgcG
MLLRRIKALLVLCLLITLTHAGVLPKHAAADVNNFVIKSFEADYYLGVNDAQTATLTVHEVITPVFPNFEQNHGILRAIPKIYNGRTVSLRVHIVTDVNGRPWKYSSYTDSDNLVLKIGDPDTYVQGEQTYRITYEMRNVISFFDEHDEFYWDINGDQWAQPFETVTARVHVATDVAKALQDRRQCYAGSYGFNERECSINPLTTAEGKVYTASAQQLGPYQTLTVALGFNKGTFSLGPEIAAEARRKQLLLLAAGVSFLLPVGITTTKLVRRWRRDGRDPEGRGVIVPEYNPPKELNTLASSVILHERLESKAISAFIVELAVRKYVHIYEIPKKGLLGKVDYELEVVNDPSDLNEQEKSALNLFFSGGASVGSRVKLSSLKNKLYSQIQKLDTSFTQELYQQGYFKNDPHKTRKRYLLVGIVLLVAGFVIGFGVVTLPFALGLGLSGVITMIVSGTMPARSQRGVIAKEQLYGLREYMKLAEAERLKILQSPEGAEKLPDKIDSNDPKSRVKLFEMLLPYAMLFGIEKNWAKQFEHLYDQPPDWYSGNWSTFNTAHLASSLGGFASASTTSFTAPSSSGSSGFSGGSSGGGGGGGGGGGW